MNEEQLRQAGYFDPPPQEKKTPKCKLKGYHSFYTANGYYVCEYCGLKKTIKPRI